MTSFPSKTATTRVSVAGIAVIAASIAVVLFSGHSSLSTASVEASLKRFGEYVASDSAKSGKEGKFTYGAIDMKGFFMNRYALVHDINLEIKKQSLLESVAWSLSTPEMAVVNDPLSASRLYYVFGDPIDVKKNGTEAAIITFSDPLKYGQIEMRHNGTMTLMQNFKLPESITITPAGAQSGNVQVTYDKNPTVEIRSSLEKPERHAKYEFHNIAVTAGAEKPLSIGGLKSNLSEKPGQNDVLEGHYELNISALKTETLTKPCDINADISYTGDQPLLKLAGMVSGSLETVVNVKQAAIYCTDFKIITDGTLGRSPEDPLPNGHLNVKIEQVNQLLASNLLSDQARSVLSQILMKVTGQPVESLTTVDIPLKREKNGTFYVGDVTFEELATTLFTNMFTPQGVPVLPAPQPKLPVTETPVDQQEQPVPDPETTLLDPSKLPEKTAPAGATPEKAPGGAD